MVSMGASISELHRNVTVRNVVLCKSLSSGTTQIVSNTTSLHLPVQKAYILSLEFQPDGQVSGFPHI